MWCCVVCGVFINKRSTHSYDERKVTRTVVVVVMRVATCIYASLRVDDGYWLTMMMMMMVTVVDGDIQAHTCV